MGRENFIKDSGFSVYGLINRKDVDFVHSFERIKRMEKEYDDRVVEYWLMSENCHGVKLKTDEGIDCEEMELKITMV